MPKIDKFQIIEMNWDDSSGGEPPPGVVWVLIRKIHCEAVEYMCPCGCGDHLLIYVFRPDESATGLRRWQFKEGGHLIDPSVRHEAGCKSHYYILEDGTVKWC